MGDLRWFTIIFLGESEPIMGGKVKIVPDPFKEVGYFWVIVSIKEQTLLFAMNEKMEGKSCGWSHDRGPEGIESGPSHPSMCNVRFIMTSLVNGVFIIVKRQKNLIRSMSSFAFGWQVMNLLVWLDAPGVAKRLPHASLGSNVLFRRSSNGLQKWRRFRQSALVETWLMAVARRCRGVCHM